MPMSKDRVRFTLTYKMTSCWWLWQRVEELKSYLFRPPLPEVADVSCDPNHPNHHHNEDS